MRRITRSAFWTDELGAIVARRVKKVSQELYTMSLPGESEQKAVIAAVNQGIDSYLEICYCAERGDSFERGERSFIAQSDGPFIDGAFKWRKGDKVVHTVTLECKISPASMPTFIRRLMTLPDKVGDSVREAGESLASDICEHHLKIELV